ncbi:MAG: EAL domain-containing protein [Candidatus Thiodiazotropha sp. (ex Monitilora ramsayi)]|nr:EAL domain-containing protein [Candidatus Thiodiazotropha sp. (ex Monitilora ramsayi)]
MTPNANQRSPRFFSLKWKVVLLFSLILLIVNAGLAAMGYFEQRQLFHTYQLQIREQQARQVKALLEKSFYKLEQIAQMIPALAIATSPSRQIPLAEKMQHFFEHSAFTLDLEWGLEEASFFSPYNERLFSWQVQQYDNGSFKNLVNAVNSSELPLNMLHCGLRCSQFVAVPLLDNGKKAGVLLVGRSLADIVIEFTELAKADIAVISKPKELNSLAGNSRYLREWKRYIAAASNMNHLMPLLDDFTHQIDMKSLITRDFTGSLDDHHYTLSLVPASSDTGIISADFLIVSDITSVVKQIRTATAKSVFIGVAGFIISEILLLLILRQPLKRLLLISDSLPLMAKNAFNQVRDKLTNKHRSWFQDEIDIAGDSAIDLTHTLERLNQEVKDQTERLVKHSEELSSERDFLTAIMNSAQVIILTQDCDGTILTINEEGRDFIGVRNYHRGSRYFSDSFMGNGDNDALQHALTRIKIGMVSSYQHDASSISADGNKRTISWIHSHLPGKPYPNVPILLSVGLDITDREVAKQRLTWLAGHDPLTELYNRRNFQIEFEKILTLAERYHHHTSLIFLDLDHFKYINDSSGHQAGDALLQIVAKKLREVTRTSDLIARLGGDEFAIVIPESDSNSAIQFTDKLLHELKQVSLPLKGRSYRVSASIGIVTYPEHGSNYQELLSNADLAMYQAKEAGRDRWHLFTPSEQAREQMSAKVTWKQKIEQALAEERFILHFQPIMHIESGEISHYEVLIRMIEKDGSLIMPGEFISVAERTGLIHPINRYVLRASIEKLSTMQSLAKPINLSINLSGRVIDDPQLLQQLTQMLNDSQVDPGQLVFELTETAALADVNAAERLMTELQTLGCRFALDDFGVGFSSFYYLRELPLDIVKIDGSFIKQLPTNTKDQVFVKALTDMATALGKETIAEFVEDEPTLRLLSDMGVIYAQGYHIGRPSPEIPVASGRGNAVATVLDHG